MTPQVFERFFLELSQTIAGKPVICPLGKDFREGISPLTSNLFKSSKQKRLFASTLETALWLASTSTRILGGSQQIQAWAKNAPTGIGVIWTKN